MKLQKISNEGTRQFKLFDKQVNKTNNFSCYGEWEFCKH